MGDCVLLIRAFITSESSVSIKQNKLVWIALSLFSKPQSALFSIEMDNPDGV